MIFHKSRWQKNNMKFENSLELAKEFHLSEKIITILKKRGLETSEALNEYLYPSIDNLHDPFLLKDMSILVDTLKEIKKNDEKLIIYGDYDVDGITSISILYNYLKGEGYNVGYYIPNRFDEGYGINSEALGKIKASGANLVVSVDCGITSVEEAAYAKTIGLSLFITDHHECQEEIPDCLGIINPKQLDCQYPYDMLAGAGIALKIVQALAGDAFKTIYPPYMEIAAIGTIADIAPLTGENRIIAKYGLKALENTNNLGLKSLLQVTDLIGKELNAGHVGFGIGPRLNAAGRVDSANVGVQLLTTNSLHEAQSIADELNTLNKKRQDMEQEIIADCIKQVESHGLEKNKILVLSGENWHTGVIGIVASRISERYYKPTIILNIENGIAKGSARSVGAFSIFDAMNASKSLFHKFGGHKAAAGVSLLVENLEKFKEEINAYGQKHMTTKDFYPRIPIDAVVASEDIAHEFAESLEALKPFGLGNPKPCFVYNDLIVDTVRWLGKEGQHLKLSVHDGTRVYECIKFNGSEEEKKIRTGDRIDAVFTLDINKFRGVENLQFALKDIFVKSRISESFEEDFFISFVDRLSCFKEQDATSIEPSGQPTENLYEKLQEHISKQEGFIISVGTIEALREIEQFFIDQNFENYNWGFRSGDRSDYQIIVNPCAYSPEISVEHYGVDLLTENDGVVAYYSKQKRQEYKVYKEKLTVQLSLYKFLYKELVALKEKKSLKVLGESMKLAPYLIYLAAKVFEEKGLLEIDYKDGCLSIVKVHKPSQKVDLMSAKIIKRIKGL